MKRMILTAMMAMALMCSTTVSAQSVQTDKQKKECCDKQKKHCDKQEGCKSNCKKCTECKPECSQTGCKDCSHKGQCKKNCKK